MENMESIMKSEKKDNAIKIFKNSGIIILMVITAIITLTSILYFFRIEITKFHLPIIYILANIAFLLIYTKKCKEKLSYLLISCIIALIVFVGSILFVGHFYDLTSDGNTYHKLAIGSLKNGWNPVYENNEDFNKEQGNAIDISQKNKMTLWTDHYTKGNWMFSAVIYAFTGNIEAGKATTILLMYICIVLVTAYLSKKTNLIFSVIIGILLAVNPISIVQTINYYIDGDLGLSLYIILLMLISITDKKEESSKLEKLIILTCGIIICTNIKFTGLAFAGLFCFLFYIYWLYLAKKEGIEKLKKEAKFYTIFYTVIVLVSVCIIGYSSYFKNTLEHGHPFYPLYGKGKVDIITEMQPNYFAKRNVVQKFLISIFSEGKNVTYSFERDDIKPKLKVPFTFTKEELENYCIPDIRINGFGPLFSGILIISSIVTLYALYDLIKNKKKDIAIPYILILAGIVILLLIIDGSWWARYTPYLYCVPILALAYLLYRKDKKIRLILGSVLAITMILNSTLLINTTVDNYKKGGKYVETRIGEFEAYTKEQEVTNIKLNDLSFQGALYNLIDKNFNIEINDTIEANREGYHFVY